MGCGKGDEALSKVMVEPEGYLVLNSSLSSPVMVARTTNSCVTSRPAVK